jgi:hypothetical protein
MSLVKTKCHIQPGHPLRIPLTEANHQTQPAHPSRMPLAKANR